MFTAVIPHGFNMHRRRSSYSIFVHFLCGVSCTGLMSVEKDLDSCYSKFVNSKLDHKNCFGCLETTTAGKLSEGKYP